MTKWEELYHQIADAIPDTEKGKMFGALCIKAPNGKAGVMFWHEDMIFKLPEKDEQEALSLKGAKIFEPMAGRPMGGWVHIPNKHADKWKKYAISSMKNVATIKVEPKAVKAKKTAKPASSPAPKPASKLKQENKKAVKGRG
jgi:hypothetical protein